VAKKADLEASFREYSARCAEAARAEVDRDYPRVLESAESTLPLAREAIAYLRRYQRVPAPRLVSVSQILRYAPPLFARRSLDRVDKWFAEGSRAERKAYPDLPEQLQAARRVMALAARLWPSWRAAAPPVARGDDPKVMMQLMDVWTSCGAVVRREDARASTFQLVSHPQRRALGKCVRCGHEKEDKWIELLGEGMCPHCRAISSFVILARIG